MKKTSATGYLKGYLEDKNEILIRRQDIYKDYWLCGCCEKLFNSCETEFANNIFYPFIDHGKIEAIYGDWMSKFCASISWRTLTLIRSKNKNDESDNDQMLLYDKTQDHLRRYLLGEADNLYQYEQHLFPFKQITSIYREDLPLSINRYLLRCLGMDIIRNSTDEYIFTKIPSFILLGVIKAKNLKPIRSSRISIQSGKIFLHENYRYPNGLIDYIFEKAEEMIKIHKAIPKHNLSKAYEYIHDHSEEVIKSRQFQTMIDDYNLFGDDVFR